MKQSLSKLSQQKTVIILLCFTILPVLLFTILGTELVKQSVLKEKAAKLEETTKILSAFLPESGFAGILEKNDALDTSRENKIKILHQSLSGFADLIARAYPHVELGYFSTEVDAIIAYGPSSRFASFVGTTLEKDHPIRKAITSEKALGIEDAEFTSNILGIIIPITHEGKVTGAVWAAESKEVFQEQYNTFLKKLAALTCLCISFSLCFFIFLYFNSVQNIEKLKNALSAIRTNRDLRIPKLSGMLNVVAQSLNELTEEVHRAEKNYQKASHVMTDIMQNITAAILICDPDSLRLVYVNPYGKKIWNVDDYTSKHCYEVLHHLDHPCEDCPHKDLFKQNPTSHFSILRKEFRHEASQREFLVYDSTVQWYDGKFLHMRLATDITVRKARLATEANITAQRDFLARMSHEIRTPMNGVLGMTRMALNTDPPPNQRAFLEKIQLSGTQLLNTINDILDYSRIEAHAMTIEKKVFDLHLTLKTIEEHITNTLEDRSISFTRTIENSVPQFVVGDSLRFSQVLTHILDNAVKFTSSGNISLHVSAHTLHTKAMRLNCIVNDSGIGMSTKHQEELFKPFSQADVSTSRQFGGTGLGLAISKALIELMGGQIIVKSAEGRGSTFSFFIELQQTDLTDKNTLSQLNTAQLLDKNEKGWESARYDGMHFLLAEDNVLNQEITKAILEDLGATVALANNGQEALQYFLEKTCDAIFMDMCMPVMDGIEATKRIRKSIKLDATNIPIIAMTGNTLEEDKQQALDAGMNAHVTKPIDVTTLQKIMYTYIYLYGGR